MEKIKNSGTYLFKLGDDEKDLELHNKITNFGISFYGSKASLILGSGIPNTNYLTTLVKSNLVKGTSSTTINNAVADGDIGLTVYLLNLPENYKCIRDSEYPFIDDKGNVNEDYIIGYANISTDTPNLKEGLTALFYRPDIIKNGKMRSGRAWKWEAGRAIGTINAIALGVSAHKNPYRGGIVSTIVTPEKVTGGKAYFADLYARNGIPNITADNEILVGFSGIDVYAKGVLNLSTWTYAELPDDDVRRTIKLGNIESNQIVTSDGTWYYIQDRNIIRRGADGSEKSVLGRTTTKIASLFLHNGKLYECRDNMGSPACYAYNIDTLVYTSSDNILFSTITPNIPPVMTSLSTIGKDDNGNFLLCDYKNDIVIECTSLDNALSSMVTFYHSPSLAKLSYDNEYVFITNEYRSDENIAPAGTLTASNKGGIKFIDPNKCGNMISILDNVKDDKGQPITLDGSKSFTMGWYSDLTNI